MSSERVRPSLAALLLVCLSAVSGAAGLTALQHLNRPSLLSARASEAPGGTLRHRVLLIVVDGLGEETARGLPTLQRLAAEGASARVWAEVPTFSSPAYVALLTGVSPALSGRRTNADLFPVALDSLPAQLVRAGHRTCVLSDEVDWWQRLLPGAFTRAEVVAPGALVTHAAQVLPGADFAVVHPCGVDAAGHAWGAASPSYREAALRVDQDVAQLLALWGYPDAPVVVVADHGHMDAGGHGGGEPQVRRTLLVAAGPGVRTTGALPDMRAVDVAPTLAALMGTPAPARAEGHTAVGLLALEEEERTRLAAEDARRIARVHEEAGATVARLKAAARPWQAARLGLVLLLLLALGWLGVPQPRAFARGALGGALALGGVTGALWLWSGVSFSGASESRLLFLRTLGLASVATVLLLGVTSLRLPVTRPVRAAQAVGFVALFSLPALALFVHQGAFTPRLDATPALLAVGPFLAYTALAPAALLAAVWCLTARRVTAEPAGSPLTAPPADAPAPR
jgi:hypothetical protein